MTLKKTFLALALTAAATVAIAGPEHPGVGPYVSIDAGLSTQAGVETTASDKDAMGVAIGYNFDRTFGVELSHFDLDSRRLSYPGVGIIDWTSKATAVAATLRTEVNQDVELSAKVGIASTSLTASSGGASAKLSHTGLVFGVGAEYRLDRNWSVKGGIDVYPDFAGSTDTMSTATVGVKYRF